MEGEVCGWSGEGIPSGGGGSVMGRGRGRVRDGAGGGWSVMGWEGDGP